MAVVTIYRLAEQIKGLLDGANPPAASSISFNAIKISIAQVANSVLKTEYLQVNGKLGETIPNGTMIGEYSGITPVSWVTGRSKATIPIKPVKLPRNMGVWSIFLTEDPTNEFIPMQMGQSNMLKSQPMINDLLGQIGYEQLGGLEVGFTKDLPLMFPGKTISMRLAILDISQYDDYDILPILPEQEWSIIQEVYKLYSTQPIPDKLVDATVKEDKNVPLKQQSQS